MLECIELGAQRTVDHAAAKLHPQSPDNRWIDLYVDPDILSGHRVEGVADLVAMRIGQRLGDRDLRRHLALVASDQGPVSLDDVADRKQPAVGCHNLKKLRREPRDFSLVEHRSECLRLYVGGEHRAADEACQVRALIKERVESLKIGQDGIDGPSLERQLEQGRGITARHSGIDWILPCHRLTKRLCVISTGEAPPELRRKPLKMCEDLDFSGTPGLAQPNKIAGLLTQGKLRRNTAVDRCSSHLPT